MSSLVLVVTPFLIELMHAVQFWCVALKGLTKLCIIPFGTVFKSILMLGTDLDSSYKLWYLWLVVC